MPADSGSQHAELVRDDLCCVQCRYSLRGLPGDRVTCPECGQVHDIAAMMTRVWHKPWWTAPGFQNLMAPIGWLSVMSMAPFIIGAYEIGSQRPLLLSPVIALIVLAVWCAMIYRVRNVTGPGRGFALTLGVHGLFFGYLVCVIGGVGAMLASLNSAGELQRAFLFLALSLFAVLLLWLLRRGERAVARCCLRAWLRGVGAATA